MDNTPTAVTRRLIDDLKLTRSEERELRYLAGIRNLEPRRRVDRFFQLPLTGPKGVLLALLVLVILAALLYLAWRLVTTLHLVPYLEGIGLFLLVLSAVFDLWVRGRLIRKLYRTLEGERSSHAELNKGTAEEAMELL